MHHTMFTKAGMPGGHKKEAQDICFGDATGYIKKVGCDEEGLGQ